MIAPPGPRRIIFGTSPLYRAASPSSRATINIVGIVDLYFIWPTIGWGPCNEDKSKNRFNRLNAFVRVNQNAHLYSRLCHINWYIANRCYRSRRKSNRHFSQKFCRFILFIEWYASACCLHCDDTMWKYKYTKETNSKSIRASSTTHLPHMPENAPSHCDRIQSRSYWRHRCASPSHWGPCWYQQIPSHLCGWSLWSPSRWWALRLIPPYSIAWTLWPPQRDWWWCLRWGRHQNQPTRTSIHTDPPVTHIIIKCSSFIQIAYIHTQRLHIPTALPYPLRT